MTTQRDLGLVSQVFDERSLQALTGEMAIGHVRYSTTGRTGWENAQPVYRHDRRPVALAHNGNLINAVELYNELLEQGARFRSTSDSEIIAALIASHPAERIEDAVAAVMEQLAGRLLDGDHDRGRDRGLPRPGRHPARSASARSRTATSSPPRAARSTSSARELLREVQPGELVSICERGLEVRQAVESERPALLRLRAHLLLAPRLEARGPHAPVRARPHGRDPRPRGAGRGRPRDLRARLRATPPRRASRAPRGSRRTTA